MSTSKRRARIAVAALAALQVFGAVAPAGAAPVAVARDRVDGGTFFTWDAATGTFPEDGDYGSAVTVRKGDRVRFFADAKPVEGAPAGERLEGTLSLRLKAPKAVRYSGTFTFVVRWGDDVFYRAKQDASFTLRPTTGKRKKVLRFPFDLSESGTYAVTGKFRAAS